MTLIVVGNKPKMRRRAIPPPVSLAGVRAAINAPIFPCDTVCRWSQLIAQWRDIPSAENQMTEGRLCAPAFNGDNRCPESWPARMVWMSFCRWPGKGPCYLPRRKAGNYSGTFLMVSVSVYWFTSGNIFSNNLIRKPVFHFATVVTAGNLKYFYYMCLYNIQISPINTRQTAWHIQPPIIFNIEIFSIWL